MQILIPMAGNGQRFVDAGYKDPKPFIDVLGKPMIERVVENLGGPSAGEYIFVVQAPTYRFNPIPRLRDLVPGCMIVTAKEPTAGAACTALLAAEFIDSNEPLLIANSDQIIEGIVLPSPTFAPRGAIYTFEATNPKWSFAVVDGHGRVWGVVEKQVLGRRATCGLYWWQRGSDFVRCARKMIERNLRVMNEFYLAPAYNELLAEGHVVIELPVQRMHGLGDPESLQEYIQNERAKEA